MGIISNVIDFVFLIQRPLYGPAGRFVSNSNQFRSPNLQRRFRRRLWPNGQNSIQRARANPNYQPQSSAQFRRPLARTIIPTSKPMQLPIVQKKNFFSEMFSPNINPPAMQAQQKKPGFGKMVLDAARWNNILRR